MHFFWILVLVLLSSCNTGSDPSKQPAVVPTPASSEILIVSHPSGAKILLGDSELGTTPMTIKITAQTSLILELPGYTRQAVLLTPNSGPNLVVQLVPEDNPNSPQVPPPAVAIAPTPPDDATDAQPRETKTSRTSKSSQDEKHASSKAVAAPSSSDSTASAPPQPSTTVPPSAPSNPSANVPSAPKPPRKFDTMREVKEAYRKGEIDRNGYKEAQADIRRRIKEETDDLKKKLREGKITKDEYEQQARAVKIKFEG